VRTFQSVLLPIKAVVLNLVSLSAVFGAVVFFWQHGNGSDGVFGISQNRHQGARHGAPASAFSRQLEPV